MNAAHWLAWVLVAWMVVGSIWEWIDNPIDRTWNSNFYLFTVFLLNIAIITLALVILI